MASLEKYFHIITTRNCPMYETGNRFKLSGLGIESLEKKPVCLFLSKSISEIVMTATDEDKSEDKTKKQAREFNCSGCSGLIKFSAEENKGYQTQHMQLLAAAERRRQMEKYGSMISFLSNFSFFKAMEENSLKEIIASTSIRQYAKGQAVLMRGQQGANMFIVIDGKVELVSGKGESFSYLGMGEIFGEMSLLSGNPVSVTIKAVEPLKVLVIKASDFQQILVRYPFLQMAFTRLLVQRLAAISSAKPTASAGISGRLREISAAELFQMFHENMKSGRIDLKLPDGKAQVLFQDGEVVLAQCKALHGIEAFYAILKEQDGTFTFSSVPNGETKELKPIGGFMKLLMDGLRQIDEAEEDQR